jgi:hypothetical protein
VTRDPRKTWEQLPLPAGLQYPQVTFFSPTEGVLVARETQGEFGNTFYTTADGGHGWTPVPQGANLTRLGVTIDFANAQDGFAWTNGLESDPVPPNPVSLTGFKLAAGRWRAARRVAPLAPDGLTSPG